MCALAPKHPRKDLEQNTIATHNVLESMRANALGKSHLHLPAPYTVRPRFSRLPRMRRFLSQTSLYGASKLACEGLIAAYCEAFGFQSWIFRFVSILGERYSHGHVFDFCKQLSSHPT